jgi:hypothetical protein
MKLDNNTPSQIKPTISQDLQPSVISCRRPPPRRDTRCFPGYCPPTPRGDNRMIIEMLQNLIALLSKLLGTGGKQPPPPIGDPLGINPGKDPRDVSRFVGMNGEQARALAVQEGIQSIRIVKPGHSITLEYRQDRLNLNVDEAGNVTSANWG